MADTPTSSCLENLTDEERAYIYTTIVLNKTEIYKENGKDCIEICVREEDVSEYLFFKLVGFADTILEDKETFIINDETKISDICKFFEVDYIKDIDNIVDIKLDDIFVKNNKNINREIIKAYYERYGNVFFDTEDHSYKCNITGDSHKHNQALTNHIGIPCKINKIFEYEQIAYYGVNIIDFLGYIYNNDKMIFKIDLYNIFLKIIGNRPVLKYMMVRDDAISPTKANFSDVGFDLTIIGEHKVMNSKTKLYNTGIKLEIPTGYYVEIVPRSSISKSGYMLANSIGIIDCSYKGELFVALTKIDEESPDITFPFKCCQLIMRQQIFPTMTLVESVEDSKRAEGGFGSSG